MRDFVLGEEAVELPLELSSLIRDDLARSSVSAEDAFQESMRGTRGGLGFQGDELHPLGEVLDAHHHILVASWARLQGARLLLKSTPHL